MTAIDNGTQSRGNHEEQNHRTLVFPEDRLSVAMWSDPVLERLGHDLRSEYVERYWLPILGPSSLLFIRRLSLQLTREPGGFNIDPAEWAAEMGLGLKGGRHGPFWRAMDRSCRFGAASRNGQKLIVRPKLPPLSPRQLERLPSSLQRSHAANSVPANQGRRQETSHQL